MSIDMLYSALESKKAIMMKCALTVDGVITVRLSNSCFKLMHEHTRLSLLFLLIRISTIKYQFHLAYGAVGIILPGLYRPDKWNPT